MLVGVETVFFRSVLHQLYGTAELHFQIHAAGIRHLNNNPEFYVELPLLPLFSRTHFPNR